MSKETTSLLHGGRRASVVKIQEEQQIQVPTGFKLLVNILEWAPLWCFWLIGNVTYAYTAAFVVVVLSFCLTFVQKRMGELTTFPKPLDVIFVVVFGSLTFLSWAYPNNVDTIERYSGSALNGGLALGFLVSWSFGKPVVRGYQVDKLGEEKASHPVLQHIASWLSLMFTAAFASVAIIGAIFYGSDWALLFSNLILAGAFLTAYRFLPAYVKDHTEEIASLYRNEIDEWESKYPETSFEKELA